MIFKTDLQTGPVDISDLRNDRLVQFQHRWYFCLLLIFGYALPTLVPGVMWGDWKGGFYFAASLRLTIAHHVSNCPAFLFVYTYAEISFSTQSTFCINSIAHYLGDTPYDDKLSPRDHLLSAILTMGEGYHNFHHQFPMDYRNAFLWYQYDPTKWFIAVCSYLRLANHLRVFPRNEILKGSLSMKLKVLRREQESLKWPTPLTDLPVVTWEACESLPGFSHANLT